MSKTEIGTAWANAVRAATRAKSRSAPSWWDSEVDWYANQRDGELGMSAMPLEPSTGSSQAHDGVPDRSVRAATRARLLEAAMGRLDSGARLLLLAVHTRISPRAHKDKHAAQARCIAAHEGEILVAVAILRRQPEYARAARGAWC